MFKIFKNKLMIILVTGTVIGGISIKNLLMFDNVYKKSQDSNIKENYINDVTVNSQNTYKSDTDKDLNSLSDIKNLSDNFQYNNSNTNKQETIKANLEKSSNNNNTNNQITTSSQLKDANSNVNTNNQATTSSQLKDENSNTNTNNQTATSSQLKDENSNKNTENKDATNADLEVKVPTIHYDRTTSIYDDDKVTLLRIEYYSNNKLIYYSDIEQFDATTKSYIEKIYLCNRETNIDPLIRTDVYVNGNLTKSY